MSDRSVERRHTAGTALMVVGCGFLALATVVPVMRWDVNAAHDTAGDARIWLGDAWTLADGGFQGAALLPVSSVAVLVLALVAVFGRGRAGWWSTVALAAVAAYVPLWTAVAFARKWEDQVEPDIGAWFLVAGSLAIAVGLWFARPVTDGATAPPDSMTRARATSTGTDGTDLP